MALISEGARSVCSSANIWKRIADDKAHKPLPTRPDTNRHGSRKPGKLTRAVLTSTPTAARGPWKVLMARQDRSSVASELSKAFFKTSGDSTPLPRAGFLDELRATSLLSSDKTRSGGADRGTRCDTPIFGGSLALIPVAGGQTAGALDNKPVPGRSEPLPIAKAA